MHHLQLKNIPVDVFQLLPLDCKNLIPLFALDQKAAIEDSVCHSSLYHPLHLLLHYTAVLDSFQELCIFSAYT